MKQLTKPKAIWYHFYPGILLALFFVIATPFFYGKGIPPQLILLIGIPLSLFPSLYFHLKQAQKDEGKATISALIGYREKLSRGKQIGYTLGLIVFAFLIYGALQPLSVILGETLLSWLPEWYTVYDMEGYSKTILIITLVSNLIINGFFAPIAEEIYFRGYLLPRMETWAKLAPFVNAILFSLYHFWQPQIYLTLIIALMPMTYLVWKTKSLKLGIYTHCGINLFGALLSFAMLNQ